MVLGRSNIVGKPMAHLLMERNATVTVCHSKTTNLSDELLRADVLVIAIGKAEFIKGESVKEGAVVIDVGINRTDDGKLVGTGTHEELLDSSEVYREIYYSQFPKEKEEVHV